MAKLIVGHTDPIFREARECGKIYSLSTNNIEYMYSREEFLEMAKEIQELVAKDDEERSIREILNGRDIE